MTPDMSAETWLGAAGCAIGSQTCSGIDAGLRAESRGTPAGKLHCASAASSGGRGRAQLSKRSGQIAAGEQEEHRHQRGKARVRHGEYHPPARTVPG